MSDKRGNDAGRKVGPKTSEGFEQLVNAIHCLGTKMEQRLDKQDAKLEEISRLIGGVAYELEEHKRQADERRLQTAKRFDRLEKAAGGGGATY